MLLFLAEFACGFEMYQKAAEESEDAEGRDPCLRFYLNSLYQYCANFYIVRGSRKLLDRLGSLDCADLLEDVERILLTPVGAATLDTVLISIRNKWLVHQVLDPDLFAKEAMDSFDFTAPETTGSLAAPLYELLVATRNLYNALRERFPEAGAFGIH